MASPPLDPSVILNQGLDGICILTDLVFEYVNEPLARMSGYTVEELIGTNLTDHLAPGYLELILERATLRMNGGDVPSIYKVELYKKDGSNLPVEVSISVISHKGKVSLLVFVRDITERERADRELEAGELKFKDLFENNINGIARHQVIMDENGIPVDYVFLEINGAFEALTGLKRENLLGRRVTEALPGIENDPANWIGVYGDLALNGGELSFEQFSEQLTMWYNVRAYSYQKGYFITVFENITERKRVEMERELESAVLEATNALFPPLIDPDSTMVDLTVKVLEQARLLTNSEHGYISEIDPVTLENIGHTLTMMMDACEVSETQVRFPVKPDGLYNGLWGLTLNTKKTFYSNDPDRHEMSVGIPEGHIPIRNLLSVPVLLGDEAVGQINLSNSSRDYTDYDIAAVSRLAEVYALAIHRIRNEQERDRIFQELAREQLKTAQALEMERIKTNFMSTATHEIRTPLTSIKGYTEIIQSKLAEGDTSNCIPYFDVISRNVERLEHLTDSLLDLQRIESGRMELDLETVDVSSVMKQVENELAPIVGEKQQVLVTNIEDTVGLVLMDGMRIMQVVVNLVSNASKFSELGSRIELSVRDYDDSMEVSVTDQGRGLSDEDISKLFVPFPDIELDGMPERVGLGLSICKGIIELHGGAIWAESKGSGSGARFTFRIPKR